jgi:multidrug resistance protein MdtO
VRAQADAVLFEFGPSRARKLQIRDDFRRWQPMLGTLIQVQVTGLQYLYENRYSQPPREITKPLAAFEQDMATVARAMADDVVGRSSGAAPDVQQSALELREAIKTYYEASGSPIPPALVDMVTITQNLAAIMAPLYSDIHMTFTNSELAMIHHPQLNSRYAS